MERVTTDVVIVAYQSRSTIGATVARMVADPDVGAVVVVDHGTDGSGAVAADAGAEVVFDPTNPGFGAGQNHGVGRTTSARVLLLNPDADLVTGALAAGNDALDRDPRVAMVQGVVVNDVTGVPERSSGRELTWRHLLGRAVGARHVLRIGVVRGLARRSSTLADHVDRVPSAPRDVETLAAVAVLVRRSAFDGVGGFDSRYFLYGEDLDLCARLRRAGWRLVALPVAWATHTSGASSGDWWTRELHWWQGTMQFAAQWWRGPALVGAFLGATVQWVRMTVVRPAGWRRSAGALLVRPWRSRVR